jgi:hypothetical protein
MAADDVFPAEMPDQPSSPILPLDDDTAERLLSGRLDPDDAPPAYADVAWLVRAAAAPAGAEELAGEEEALLLFRAVRARAAGVEGRSGRVRGRLVAVALVGVLVVGGAAGGATAGGLWTTGGAPSSGGLRSPSGGPGAAAAGSGAPGSVAGSGGSGLLRPAGSGAVTERERAVTRHRGGAGSRGGGAAHGAKPVRTPGAKAGKPKKPEAEKPRGDQPAPKGPKATPGQGANHAAGRRR